MLVRLLGPVDVTDDEASQPVRGLRRKAVLAALALRRGDIVSIDTLVDVVWDGAAPPAASTTLQSHVSHLRQVLGSKAAIVARPPGYLLDLDREDIDVEIAEQLIRQGTVSKDPADGVRHLRAALALWRGRPLVDVAALGWFREEATRLDEMWLRAKRELIDASLALGEHPAILRDLEQLARDHPFDERIHGQLMVALYRSGRQADALGVFHQMRRTLADELGIDASQTLRDLEASILRQEPTLDHDPASIASITSITASISGARASVDSPEPASAVVPAQLPLTMGVFAGRAGHLAQLDALLPALGTTGATAVVIASLSGIPGVGKTALAVQWAHQVADRFPDGQLYVNLRGFDPGGQPLDPTHALRGFLEALGMPVGRIPVSLQDQAAAYRSRLTGKRVLVVLDNARDAEQVRPLLPGSGGGLVIVTSRDQLTPLVATDGAIPLRVDTLSTMESLDLLARRLGDDRVAAEPAAVAEIVDRCAGLPLALAIVAARAANQPGHPLAVWARELRDGAGALDALQGGDSATDIRTVFLWSYRTLSVDAAGMFRMLGLHPGPDISLAGVASAAGVTAARARTLTAELVRAHLLTEDVSGRYALHDLLRVYATELARDHDADETRHATLTRVLDHYLHTAHRAADILEPFAGPVTPAAPTTGVSPEEIFDREAALAWYVAEHRVLLAAIDLAAAAGFDVHVWQLAWTMAPFLHPRGYWLDQAAIGNTALEAARRLDDPHAQAHAHRGLAGASRQLGQVAEARVHYEQALELAERIGDRLTSARTHMSLAWVHNSEQDPAKALAHSQLALELYVEAGDQGGEAKALNGVGWVYALLGDYQQALNYCFRGLELAQQVGDHECEAWTWDSLGYAYLRLGAHRPAVACYERALDIIEKLADPYTEAEILNSLGDAYDAMANREAARAAWERALVILDTFEHPDAFGLRAKLRVGAEAAVSVSSSVLNCGAD